MYYKSLKLKIQLQVVDKMKKILSLMLVILTLFACSISVSANEIDPLPMGRIVPAGVENPSKLEVEDQYVLSGINISDIDFITGDFEMVTAASVRSVPVTEPCDQTWRAKYPDTWMWEANRTIQAADDMLTSKYGIRFYSVSQKYWTNNATTPEAMVKDAHSQWGLCDGAKLMIAFTDKALVSGSSSIYGLVENIGKPYLLVTCYGYDENAMTVRHEVGHCYGLKHCKLGTNCVMAEAAPISTYEKICSSHNSSWNSAKTKY